MRVLVSADMEGATGVTWTDDCVPGTEPWQRMRRLFAGDVNAAVAGLVRGGATDVLVNEAHSAQRNLLLEELDERARMLTGRHKPLSMMQGIDASGESAVDGVVFLGYHAGAGQQGVLAHTYLENSITGVWLDGEPAGEGGLNAALAAEHGVPVLLVTGDDRACAEAGRYAPEATTVAVKECVSRYAAICLPPARTASMISEAAQAAMTRAGRREGAVGPHRIEVEFDAAHLADAAAVVPTVEQLDVRRVGFDAPSMTAAMQAFKIVTAIAGGAVQGIYG
ncbi:M55 family metallopeptidase [Pseudonocardia sp. TRM90224]|uniref:M55 family metallopeptidase n=1 Tax=Pseudonocardia sp. TRM90224 TaxID=2812678 RepID=UPI001E3293F3|nr:M55 family metallopeptidase [Pseudonocardia sp. TRM90224]